MPHRIKAPARLIAGLLLILLAAAPANGQDEPAPPVIAPDNAANLSVVLTLEGHEAAVTALGFDPSGEYIVTGSDDTSLRLWSSADGSELDVIFEHFSFVKDLAFSADGSRLASVSWDRSALPLTIEDERLVAGELIGGFTAVLERITFLPDGERIAVAEGGGKAVIIDVTDPATPDARLTFSLDALQVTGLDISPDGERLALGGGFPADSVVIWDLESADIVSELIGQEEGITTLAYRPTLEDAAEQIATGSGDGSVWLWENGEQSAVLQAGDWVMDLAYSPNGLLLAAALLNGEVVIWDMETGEPVATFTAHDGTVNALAFNPTGTLLGTAGDDQLAKLWAVQTAE